MAVSIASTNMETAEKGESCFPHERGGISSSILTTVTVSATFGKGDERIRLQNEAADARM